MAEAPESDVGQGRAWVDSKTRLALGVKAGDIVEILGKKATAAKLLQLAERDEGKGIIRVDGFVRRNLGVSIGDTVEVRAAVALAAKRVTLAPILVEGHIISFGQGIENFVRHGLLNRALTRGDVVIVPGIALIGGALPFAVMETDPLGIVVISEDTALDLSESPVMGPDPLYTEDRLRALPKAFRGLLGKWLNLLEKDLPTLRGDDRQRAERTAAAIRALLRELEGDTGSAPDRKE